MVLIQVNVANTDGKYVHKIECLFAKISRTCSINNRVIKGSLLLRYTFKIVCPKVANIQILFANSSGVYAIFISKSHIMYATILRTAPLWEVDKFERSESAFCKN